LRTLDSTNVARAHWYYEALCVCESHGQIPVELVRLIEDSKDKASFAYLMGIAARFTDRAHFDRNADVLLWNGATDSDARVRVAAVVGIANYHKSFSDEAERERLSGVGTASIVETILAANKLPNDKFTDLALRSAATSLKVEWESLAAKGGYDLPSDWRDRLAELQRPPGSPKSAPSAKSADKITATVPATGKLRATPEFVAALVKEVRESGDAKHGGEVYRRAELACTACHSIADQGGKIGPPLDTIGSGQPVDFIIGATLEPQREIKESYEALQLTAKDGRTALGYIAARDPEHTTIRDPASGAETKFANGDIKEQKQLGSFMPAALVDNLSREDLRDLFRYLSELGKPKP
jgi:putative heme-binding domain-containing protein